MDLNQLMVLAEAAGVDVGQLYKPFTSKESKQLVQADFDALKKAEAKRMMRATKRAEKSL